MGILRLGHPQILGLPAGHFAVELGIAEQCSAGALVAVLRGFALALQSVETWWSPTVTVMWRFGVKPLPLTATPLPTGPLLGLRVMPGLTVYPVEAAFWASDAVTVWVPTPDAGTVNAQ